MGYTKQKTRAVFIKQLAEALGNQGAADRLGISATSVRNAVTDDQSDPAWEIASEAILATIPRVPGSPDPVAPYRRTALVELRNENAMKALESLQMGFDMTVVFPFEQD